MITMLGLFIVVTYVKQRLIVLPNTAGKKEPYGSNPCLSVHSQRVYCRLYNLYYIKCAHCTVYTLQTMYIVQRTQ